MNRQTLKMSQNILMEIQITIQRGYIGLLGSLSTDFWSGICDTISGTISYMLPICVAASGPAAAAAAAAAASTYAAAAAGSSHVAVPVKKVAVDQWFALVVRL